MIHLRAPRYGGQVRGRRSAERGKPASALAILAAIFAVAVVFSVLPRQHATLLPSRGLAAWSTAPEFVPRETITIVPDAPVAAARRTVTAAPAAPAEWHHATVELPLTVAADAGQAPVLASRPLLLTAAAVAVEPSPVALPEHQDQPPQPVRAVSVAFDRTGSALLVAFRKTGEGVKSAFGALAP